MNIIKTMSEIEELLHKAENKGFREEVINEAASIKQTNPGLDLTDRYYMAYYKVKKKYKNQ